jgi:UDP-N-acetylmuramoyl-tripeptide--D-alanyl-D-alanine ligase
MIALTVDEVVEGTGGRLLCPPKDKDMIISSISTDTRSIKGGEAFFALSGINFDGHDFVQDAAGKGAALVVVKEGVFTPEEGALMEEVAFVEVSDTLSALGDLAAFVRKKSKKPVVAISGSTGKSTTKEMTAAILAVSRRVLKSMGNMNNLVGMPLTILGVDIKDDVLVLELGISEAGEMKRLTEIAEPDVAVLTNIGHGHLHGLGTIDGVAREKGDIYQSVSGSAVRVVNLDDERVRGLSDICEGGDVITYGKSEVSDVRIKSFAHKDLNHIEAVYVIKGEELQVNLGTPFEVNVYNVAAAMAAALALGVSTDDMLKGLATYVPLKGRMELMEVRGLTFIDDTYNANPESVEAALKALKSIDTTGKRIAVLGEMLELGEDEESLHKEAGRLLAALGIDVVIGIGRLGRIIAEASAEEESQLEAHGFDTNDEALSWLQCNIERGDVVLVKGSRGSGTEDIIKGFIKDEGNLR